MSKTLKSSISIHIHMMRMLRQQIDSHRRVITDQALVNKFAKILLYVELMHTFSTILVYCFNLYTKVETSTFDGHQFIIHCIHLCSLYLQTIIFNFSLFVDFGKRTSAMCVVRIDQQYEEKARPIKMRTYFDVWPRLSVCVNI